MKFHPDFHSLLRFLTSACFCTLKSVWGNFGDNFANFGDFGVCYS